MYVPSPLDLFSFADCDDDLVSTSPTSFPSRDMLRTQAVVGNLSVKNPIFENITVLAFKPLKRIIGHMLAYNSHPDPVSVASLISAYTSQYLPR